MRRPTQPKPQDSLVNKYYLYDYDVDDYYPVRIEKYDTNGKLVSESGIDKNGVNYSRVY